MVKERKKKIKNKKNTPNKEPIPKVNKINITSGRSKKYSSKDLAKIGEPATIQLFCMNTKAEYAKLKEADKHSDVLLDLQ